MNLHAVVLAAGAATRFGAPKQLARYQDQPLLLHALNHATQYLGPAVTLVLGAHAAGISAVLHRSTASLVVNRDWAEGLASSIRAGVRALPGSCDAVLLLLADQPRVDTATLQRLGSAWRRQPRSIVASLYADTVGVPAIFPRRCFGELLALRGDQGARRLLDRYADQLVRVTNPEAAIDIDSPEDLARLG
ncbi:MAG: nucleotidyltransferase family protein [Steroidobacteraceae bacterium]